VLTLCCCPPFGIVAIVYSVMVNNKLTAGDAAGAAQASKNAKMWCIIALAVGLLWWILWFAGLGAGIVRAIREAEYS
jgi:hypothetical protein